MPLIPVVVCENCIDIAINRDGILGLLKDKSCGSVGYYYKTGHESGEKTRRFTKTVEGSFRLIALLQEHSWSVPLFICLSWPRALFPVELMES